MNYIYAMQDLVFMVIAATFLGITLLLISCLEALVSKETNICYT